MRFWPGGRSGWQQIPVDIPNRRGLAAGWIGMGAGACTARAHGVHVHVGLELAALGYDSDPERRRF